MLFDTKTVLLAALAAGASAASGGSYHCKNKCSPGQIDDAFHAPSYLPDTKYFCRKFMHLPATIWVTKTKTSYVTNYHTYTKTKTKTAYPVTITNTDYEVQTITNTEVSYTTDTLTTTYTITKYKPKPYEPYKNWRLKKRVDALNDLQILKRGDYEYSSYYKVPSYLPQDLTPEQIGYACKKLKPCVTKTSTVYTTYTLPSYKTKTVITYVTTTPTAYAETTVYKTDVKTITIPKTVYTTTAATVTKYAFCNKGPAPCDLAHPESCCSGHCVKVFKHPNCCVPRGKECDVYHPQGCCSGKCKADGYSYGKPVYKCW